MVMAGRGRDEEEKKNKEKKYFKCGVAYSN